MEITKQFVDKTAAEATKNIQKIDAATGIFKLIVDKKDLEFHPNYLLTVSMSERIKIHSELQSGLPEKLFRARAPRMTDDEYKYLKGNYKQVTTPVYIDFMSTIQRIFHDANYNLSFKEETEKPKDELSFQEYLEKGLPGIGSLETYVKSIIPHIKFTDANGVIAVRPREIPTVNVEGKDVADDSQLYEPIPIYFPSSHVLKEQADEWMLLLSHEKSLVEYGGQKNQPKGYILEFYDKENIWRIEQYGKFDDYKFRTRLFYNHHWGKVPCTKLKGVPMLNEGKLIWVSPFMYAVDLLDLVTLNSTYLQVIINNCVFPYRVMYGDDCEYEYKDELGGTAYCDNGYVYDTKLEAKLICPGCQGCGLKSRINPFGVMLIRTGNASGNSDKDIGQTPMAYVEPTVETPTFLMGKIADDEMKARRILHLNTSQTQIQGGVQQMNPAANTATGMVTDLKALYAFVKPISDQIFEIWEFLIDAIGFMRYDSKYENMKPNLSYPTTFDFYTESDYMENIAMAVKSGMPPFVVQTILFKYLQSIFYNEKTTSDVFNLIYNTDRLLTMSNQDIATKQSRGLVEKWEAILHDSGLTFVKQLTAGDKEFFKKDFPEQQKALIELAKTRADEITETTNSEMAEQSAMNIEGIMKNVATKKKPVGNAA